MTDYARKVIKDFPTKNVEFSEVMRTRLEILVKRRSRSQDDDPLYNVFSDVFIFLGELFESNADIILYTEYHTKYVFRVQDPLNGNLEIELDSDSTPTPPIILISTFEKHDDILLARLYEADNFEKFVNKLMKHIYFGMDLPERTMVSNYSANDVTTNGHEDIDPPERMPAAILQSNTTPQSTTIPLPVVTPQLAAALQPTATPQLSAVLQPTATPQLEAVLQPTATPQLSSVLQPTATPRPPHKTVPHVSEESSDDSLSAAINALHESEPVLDGEVPEQAPDNTNNTPQEHGAATLSWRETLAAEAALFDSYNPMEDDYFSSDNKINQKRTDLTMPADHFEISELNDPGKQIVTLLVRNVAPEVTRLQFTEFLSNHTKKEHIERVNIDVRACRAFVDIRGCDNAQRLKVSVNEHKFCGQRLEVTNFKEKEDPNIRKLMGQKIHNERYGSLNTDIPPSNHSTATTLPNIPDASSQTHQPRRNFVFSDDTDNTPNYNPVHSAVDFEQPVELKDEWRPEDNPWSSPERETPSSKTAKAHSHSDDTIDPVPPEIPRQSSPIRDIPPSEIKFRKMNKTPSTVPDRLPDLSHNHIPENNNTPSRSLAAADDAELIPGLSQHSSAGSHHAHPQRCTNTSLMDDLMNTPNTIVTPESLSVSLYETPPSQPSRITNKTGLVSPIDLMSTPTKHGNLDELSFMETTTHLPGCNGSYSSGGGTQPPHKATEPQTATGLVSESSASLGSDSRASTGTDTHLVSSSPPGLVFMTPPDTPPVAQRTICDKNMRHEPSENVWDAPYSSSTPLQDRLLSSDIPTPCHILNVWVTHVQDNDHIWVVRQEDSPTIQKYNMVLLTCRDTTTQEVSVGDIVAVPDTDTDDSTLFCRARVVEILGGDVRVNLLDFGSTKVVPIESISGVKQRSLKTSPPLAKPYTLYQCLVKDERQFLQSATNILLNREVDMLCYEDGTVDFLISNNLLNSSFIHICVLSGSLRYTRIPEFPTVNDVVGDYKVIRCSEGNTHVQNTGHSVTQFWRDTAEPTLQSEQFGEYDGVSAYCAVYRSTWYRGRVLTRPFPGERLYSIILLDTGDIIKTADVSHLPEKYYDVPAQVIRCSVSEALQAGHVYSGSLRYREGLQPVFERS